MIPGHHERSSFAPTATRDTLAFMTCSLSTDPKANSHTAMDWKLSKEGPRPFCLQVNFLKDFATVIGSWLTPHYYVKGKPRKEEKALLLLPVCVVSTNSQISFLLSDSFDENERQKVCWRRSLVGPHFADEGMKETSEQPWVQVLLLTYVHYYVDFKYIYMFTLHYLERHMIC